VHPLSRRRSAPHAGRSRAFPIADSEGHHPDVSFGWGYATISLRTKKIKGLHENDFIMASKFDGMFEGLEHPPDRQ